MRTLATLGLVLLTMGAAGAGPGGGMHGAGGPGMHGPGMMGRPNPVLAPVAAIIMHRQMLSLTDEQVTRLQGLHVENQKAMARQLADAYAGHLDLMQLLGQPSPDRGKVDAAVRDLGRRITDLMQTQARAYLDALNALTPAQRQQVQQMVASMGMGMGMGACPGCPMGMGMGGTPTPPAAGGGGH